VGRQHHPDRDRGLGVLGTAAYDDLFDGGEPGSDAVLHVHVVPKAGRDEIRGRHGDALRVRVQAPPADGRANDSVRSLLGAAFGVPDGRVELVSGDRSRLKRFRLRGVGRASAEQRLRELLDPPDGGALP
jgi:uncharacterized protein (TIGR00251 family)